MLFIKNISFYYLIGIIQGNKHNKGKNIKMAQVN